MGFDTRQSVIIELDQTRDQIDSLVVELLEAEVLATKASSEAKYYQLLDVRQEIEHRIREKQAYVAYLKAQLEKEDQMTDNEERKFAGATRVEWAFGTLVIRAERYGIVVVGDADIDAPEEENWIGLERVDDFLALLNNAITTAKAITNEYEATK
jgi:hypothetical protein